MIWGKENKHSLVRKKWWLGVSRMVFCLFSTINEATDERNYRHKGSNGFTIHVHVGSISSENSITNVNATSNSTQRSWLLYFQLDKLLYFLIKFESCVFKLEQVKNQNLLATNYNFWLKISSIPKFTNNRLYIFETKLTLLYSKAHSGNSSSFSPFFPIGFTSIEKWHIVAFVIINLEIKNNIRIVMDLLNKVPCFKNRCKKRLLFTIFICLDCQTII